MFTEEENKKKWGEGGEGGFPIDPEKFDKIVEELENIDCEKDEPYYPGTGPERPMSPSEGAEIVSDYELGESLARKLGKGKGFFGLLKNKARNGNTLSFLFGTNLISEVSEGGDIPGFMNPLNYTVTKNEFEDGTAMYHSFKFHGDEAEDTIFEYKNLLKVAWQKEGEVYKEDDKRIVYREWWPVQ